MWLRVALCLLVAGHARGQCDSSTRPLPVTSPGPIQSPAFDGVTPYADDLLCEWVVTSPQDVRFLLTDFQLEDCINCACDALTIYNGPDDTAPQLQNLCGGNLDILPLELVGDSQLFIRFQTNTGNTGPVYGFSSAVSFVDAACGTDAGKSLYGPTGSITSPNFPSAYPTSTDCQWNFKAATGQVVELDFQALDIQPGCSDQFGQGVVFDYVQFVSQDQRTSYGRWFGNEFVPGYKFRNYDGNEPYLQFWSDSSNAFTGFNVTYAFV